MLGRARIVTLRFFSSIGESNWIGIGRGCEKLSRASAGASPRPATSRECVATLVSSLSPLRNPAHSIPTSPPSSRVIAIVADRGRATPPPGQWLPNARVAKFGTVVSPGCWIYVLRTSVGPSKANAPLVVDADAMLTIAISLELLQAVAWREHKNSRVSAASSWTSSRVATLTTVPNRFERPVSKSFRVSLQRKLLIMRGAITRDVKRQALRSMVYKSEGRLSPFCLHASQPFVAADRHSAESTGAGHCVPVFMSP